MNATVQYCRISSRVRGFTVLQPLQTNLYYNLFHIQLIQRNKKNLPGPPKYVLQDLHRKQVDVSSVPRHCVHQKYQQQCMIGQKLGLADGYN